MAHPVLSLDRVVAWPDHAVRSVDGDGLAAILMPHVNLAIWERAEGPDLPDAAQMKGIDDIGLTAETQAVEAAMRDAMIAANYPVGSIDPLARDVANQAARLADMLDHDRVAIRLEVVETDACRRFHADYVSLRLILTYVGTGTQWLDQADAARLRDGAEIDNLTVREIPAGQVALFKGREWAPDTAIVHRSPPIAGTGQRRLVLVIDPARDRLKPKD